MNEMTANMLDNHINEAVEEGVQKWDPLPGKERLERTVAALRSRGIQAEISTNRANGLARLHELIPAGSSLMTGASATLKEIGFESELMSGNHPWNWLKPAILAEKDPERREDLRRHSSNSDCFVGSVQAVTEAGEIVVVSGSGSQIAAYAYSSPRVIWVVGSQKIVADLESAFRRVREWCVPKMEELTRASGRPDLGVVGKLLIFEREMAHLSRNVHLILVDEVLGF